MKITKDIKEFTKRWIKALRSGEYQQGKDLLYEPQTNKFCCLGVACIELGFSKEKIAKLQVPSDLKFPQEQDNYAVYLTILEDLAHLNDGADSKFMQHDIFKKYNKGKNKPLSFKEIADLLEEEILKKEVL